MKRLWQRYVERMDAATLRERIMIFSAAAVLMVALLNALLIEPQLFLQRKLSRDINQRQAEIKSLQNELQKVALARQRDPDRENRDKLEALKRQVMEVESKLASEQRKFAPPEQVGALLEEMLSRNRRLQLVDMRTLPVATVSKGVAEAGKPAAQKPAAQKPAVATAGVPPGGGQIYRHGVEITVSGKYLDLLQYLKDLEKLPSQMYWGKLELSVAKHPQVTLKLSVYTLSLDLAWLVV